MKIVVLGGTGLIGSRVVRTLRENGHDVLAASGSTVNLLTGSGLSDALTGVQIVVDLTNSPSFEDSAVLNFFTTSARHLFPAETARRDNRARRPDYGTCRSRFGSQVRRV